MKRFNFINDPHQDLRVGQVWKLLDVWAMRSDCSLPRKIKLVKLVKHKQDGKEIIKWKVKDPDDYHYHSFSHGPFNTSNEDISIFMLPKDIVKYYEQI